jgi:hypothetical protein
MIAHLSGFHRLFTFEWGDYPFTPGRLAYLLKTKYRHGLRTAWYRDVVRSRILKTPPPDVPADTRCEIHVLTSEDDWLNLVWVVRTFEFYSERRYPLCIHDDGTLRPRSLEKLRATLPHAKIILRPEADARMEEVLAPFPRCRELRATNKLAPKVFDFAAFLESDRMILLDSDILFIDKPRAMLRVLDNPDCKINMLTCDWQPGYTIDQDSLRPMLGFYCRERMNSGLGLVHRGSLRIEWIEEFLTLPDILSHPHQVEQTLIALCSAKFGVDVLPYEYDVYMGPRRPGVPCRHYTGPIRHLMYREGIPQLLKWKFPL